MPEASTDIEHWFPGAFSSTLGCEEEVAHCCCEISISRGRQASSRVSEYAQHQLYSLLHLRSQPPTEHMEFLPSPSASQSTIRPLPDNIFAPRPVPSPSQQPVDKGNPSAP